MTLYTRIQNAGFGVLVTCVTNPRKLVLLVALNAVVDIGIGIAIGYWLF